MSPNQHQKLIQDSQDKSWGNIQLYYDHP